MAVEQHPLISEFPNHDETIRRLQTESAHFAQLMKEYEEVDKEIVRMENGIRIVEHEALTDLKKRRLALEDDLVHMIHEAES